MEQGKTRADSFYFHMENGNQKPLFAQRAFFCCVIPSIQFNKGNFTFMQLSINFFFLLYKASKYNIKLLEEKKNNDNKKN